MFTLRMILLLCFAICIYGCSRNQKELDQNLIIAVTNKRINRVEELLKKGADINARDDLGRSALIVAASWNFDKDSRLHELLIRKRANINAVDNMGWSALIYAASYTDLDVVKLLLQNGADVNIQDKYSETALDMIYKKVKNHQKGFDDPVVNNAIIELLKKHGAKTGKELKAVREAAEREENSI